MVISEQTALAAEMEEGKVDPMYLENLDEWILEENKVRLHPSLHLQRHLHLHLHLHLLLLLLLHLLFAPRPPTTLPAGGYL